jgi:GntR family transcriptional repressor for pyruvate dehydrogenase complex
MCAPARIDRTPRARYAYPGALCFPPTYQPQLTAFRLLATVARGKLPRFRGFPNAQSVNLMARHRKAAGDILEMREGLEAVAVELAAVRATKTDIQNIKEALAELETAFSKDHPYDVSDGETTLPQLDAAFHLRIADATHNIVLVHVMHGIHNLVQKSIEETYATFKKRNADLFYLVQQHRTIYEAIRKHDPAAARSALGTHLEFIRENASR